jgi:tetratricopeptide (TPR) repeat protein
MLCPSCATFNLGPATTCISCGLPLPAPGFIQTISRAELLIRQAHYDEAGRELIKAEAELNLARLGPEVGQLGQARIMIARGRVLFFKAQYRPAEDIVRQALTMLDDSAAHAWLRANAFNILTNIASYRDESRSAERYAERALFDARLADEPFMLGTTLNSRANVARQLGDSELAITTYKAALAYAEQTGSLSLASAICGNLANIHQEFSEVRTSLEYAIKALSLAEKMGDQFRTALMLSALGGIYITLGELEAAEGVLQRAYRLAEAGENSTAISQLAGSLAELAWLQGNAVDGYDLARQQLTYAGDDRRGETVAYAIQVHCAVKSGEISKASQAYQKITEEQKLHPAPGFNDNHYLVLTAAPVLHMAVQEWDKAQTDFEAALDRVDQHKDAYAQAQVRIIYAEAIVTNMTGAMGKAGMLLEEARQRLTLIGASGHLQKVQVLISTLQMMAAASGSTLPQ